MSFCPKCKSEYITDRKECADCGTLLVASLDDIVEEAYDNETAASVSEIAERISTDTVDDLSGDAKDVINDIADAFSDTESDESTDTADANDGDNEEVESATEHVREFVSKKDKYKDYQSTGYMFLFFGIVGIIAVILNFFGIINIFNVSGAQAVLFYIVVGGMFAIFVFVGINSFKNAGKFKAEAGSEDDFMAQLQQFINENFTAESFSECNAESDEELYFNRTEILKNAILEKYPDINAGLLEQVVDEAYDKLF